MTWRRSGLSVVSDPLMLRRILQNLMVNAVQYTERGGIRLCARRRGHGRAHRGLGHGPGHRRSRPGDDLRGVPARLGHGPPGRRRLRPGPVHRAAHGRGARSSDRSVLARRPRHALFRDGAARASVAARRRRRRRRLLSTPASRPSPARRSRSSTTTPPCSTPCRRLMERWDCDVRGGRSLDGTRRAQRHRRLPARHHPRRLSSRRRPQRPRRHARAAAAPWARRSPPSSSPPIAARPLRTRRASSVASCCSSR